MGGVSTWGNGRRRRRRAWTHGCDRSWTCHSHKRDHRHHRNRAHRCVMATTTGGGAPTAPAIASGSTPAATAAMRKVEPPSTWVTDPEVSDDHGRTGTGLLAALLLLPAETEGLRGPSASAAVSCTCVCPLLAAPWIQSSSRRTAGGLGTGEGGGGTGGGGA
ncbi:MAG: hypothetical protein WDW38_007856 [Sanguina aurantia]